MNAHVDFVVILHLNVVYSFLVGVGFIRLPYDSSRLTSSLSFLPTCVPHVPRYESMDEET